MHKSIKFWGKSFLVDISSMVGRMSIILGSLLDVVVLYRLSQQRTQSVTVSGL
jgi:F0F1-type ATP synthase assembly protein I